MKKQAKANGKRAKTPVTRESNGHWKKGQSGNPNGRPKEGEAWSAVLKWASNLTGAEAAEIAPIEMRQFFRPLKGLQLKEAISLRIMAALLFEPGSGLFNAVMDRLEGKVTQPLTVEDVTGKPDSELVAEFSTLVDAARARAGDTARGGDTAARPGEHGGEANPKPNPA